MLNVKGLSELLTLNTDGKLCQRWWLMTPNGTLLAYSQPSSTREMRNKAAMVALTWQEHAREKSAQASSDSSDDQSTTTDEPVNQIRAMRMETISSNILATTLQTQMLLVLEGGVPPRRKGFEPRTTTESANDEQYPLQDHHLASSKSAVSLSANSITSNASSSVLIIQRKKLEAMANSIIDEFERTGFEMPKVNAPNFF
jgi:hypothetical protein